MRRRRKKKTKGKREITEKKSIVEHIVSHKEIITIILGLCVSLYSIVNSIYKIMYQIKCETFYGLPGKYFNSNVNNGLLYVGGIIILLLISIAPTLMKKYDEQKENLTKIYLAKVTFSIFIGVEIGLVNVYNLIEIMRQTYKMNNFFRTINYWLNNNAYFTITVVVILGSISVLGINFIDKLNNIKQKWIKNIVHSVVLLSVMISVLTMLYGAGSKLNISIEDKTKYEFVTYDTEYVVLSSYNEKLLIVPFEIDENGQYIFKTSQYSFCEPYDGMYQYRDIKYSPRVDWNGE
ncbi:MAG: hypothetical protein IJV50_04385 [Lachnospiraceae bacterium]|nr:hypothetical protein [Lachnospiraceae bacterium]